MELLLRPTNIKPTCAMDENARNRLILCCLNANRLPTIMVAIESNITILYQSSCMGANTLYKVESRIKAMDPLDITDKKDVTATGEPSYTSAVHKWNGTMDNLNAKAVNRNTKASICNGLPLSSAGISAKLILPVAP